MKKRELIELGIMNKPKTKIKRRPRQTRVGSVLSRSKTARRQARWTR